MKKLNNLCIIADGYPSINRMVNTFVEQLVSQFVDSGVSCTVIAPQSLTRIILKGQVKEPFFRIEKTVCGREVKVYSPLYFTFSSKKIGFLNTSKINVSSFKKAVNRVFKKLSDKFDAVYGHFIFPAGIVTNYIGKKYELPSFFAYGESSDFSIKYLGAEETRKRLNDIKGVVAVSTANKNTLVNYDIINETKIEVFPNAVNTKVFYPREKEKARNKYKINNEDFVIAFLGRFIKSKGIVELCEALKELKDVKSIFIGSGDIQPDCNGIIFCGKKNHKEIPELLSAADVFVLPTRAEGCCNSIVEAMACGLPIISSNYDFNKDILDDTCSIMVDPCSKEEIKKAILKLKEDNMYKEQLSAGALKMSKKLKIEDRTKKIISFIEEKMGE